MIKKLIVRKVKKMKTKNNKEKGLKKNKNDKYMKLKSILYFHCFKKNKLQL